MAAATIQLIGGGAGFDLDSLLTILEGPLGETTAIVGDIEAGRDLLERIRVSELLSFRDGFLLKPAGERLREDLLKAQQSERAGALARYLGFIQKSLEEQGLEVHRLPLFVVPVRLLEASASLTHEDFLITWNNVVVEKSGRIHHAEGFAQLVPTGDEQARAVFAEHGYQLDLLPLLVRSVILIGGYRCASQHLRSR